MPNNLLYSLSIKMYSNDYIKLDKIYLKIY